jgi:hypothetical protein
MLFQLLKSVGNWVSKSLQGLADAEDRFVDSMFDFEEEDKDDSNES